MGVLFQLSTIALLLLPASVQGAAFPNPVGFWMLDDIHYGEDLSGNGNHATIQSGVTWSDGPFLDRKVVTFNRAADRSSRVDIVQQNSALRVPDDFTYIIYLRLDGPNDGPLFHLGPPGIAGTIFWICCGEADYKFHWRLDNGAAEVGSISTSFTQGVWRPVAVTRERATGIMKLFLDGEEVIGKRVTGSTHQLETDYDNIIHMGSLPAEYSDERRMMGAAFCQMWFGVALTTSQINAAMRLCANKEDLAIYSWPKALGVWPLNDIYGAVNSADISPELKDSTASKLTPAIGPDKFEKDGAFWFKNDWESYVSIANDDGRYDATSFSFTAYIKPHRSPFNGQPIFTWYAAAAPSPLHLFLSGQKLYQSFQGTQTTSNIDVIVDGQWQHIAFTYDYSTGTFSSYVDGKLIVEHSYGQILLGSTSMLWIGRSYAWDPDERPANMDMSCAGFYPIALDEVAIQRVRKSCLLDSKGYENRPSLVLPLNRQHGLKEKGQFQRLATLSTPLTYTRGYRKMKAEAALLTEGSVLTLPDSTVEESWSDWTLALLLKPSADTQIELLGNIVVLNVTSHQLLVKLETQTHIVSLEGSLIDESWWLGVTFDAHLRSLIVYQDGEPYATKYIDDATPITSNQTLHIEVVSGSAAVQCYQLYDEALNLRQFFVTRHACLSPKGAKSLPYPTAFWPLNGEHQTKDLTGRAGPFTNMGGVTFNAIGPYGNTNGGAVFNSSDPTSLMYVNSSRATDPKFSATFSAWVKTYLIPSSNPTTILTYSNLYSNDSVESTTIIKIRTSATHYTQPYPKDEYVDYHVQRGAAKNVETGVWTHLTYVHDFMNKDIRAYSNGVYDTSNSDKRMNRFISKTDFPITLGNSVRGGVVQEEGYDGEVACVQIYDQALTDVQIKKLMEICQPGNLGGTTFETVDEIEPSWSLSEVNRTISVNSKLACLQECSSDTSCQSVAYADGECDISSLRYDENNLELVNLYIDTGKSYLEKALLNPTYFY